ncbi:hypothetical protein D3C81_1051580 [compost metagenome]
MLGMGDEVPAIARHRVIPGHHQLAFAQLLGHQIARNQGDATAGDGRADAQVERVETRSVVAVLAVQAQPQEPLVPGLRPRRALQQTVLGQGLGAVEGVPGQQLWGAHRQHFFAEQLDAGRPRPGALAEEERDIGLGLYQVEGLQFVADVEVDARVTVTEALEPGHQPAGAEGGLGGDAQHLGFIAVAEDIAAGNVDLSEDLVHLGQVQRARRRQVQAPADALEQRVREHLLKLRHLFADGALGQVQLLRRAGKAQMAGGRFETLKGGGRGHQAFGHDGRLPSKKGRSSFHNGIMCFEKVVC